MKAIRAAVAALSIAVVTAPAGAHAYPIDCAILLCLAGGWPASVECSAARAEFIRRITPWPVEPPLQIWRCPMGASYAAPASPIARLYKAAEQRRDEEFRATMRALAERIASAPEGVDEPVLRVSETGVYSTENGRADIDISAPEFDFVRSIRVFDVDWRRYYVGGDDNHCETPHQRVRVGTYGSQGEFGWRGIGVSTLPSWMRERLSTRRDDCPYFGVIRAIGVEWRDYAGNYSYELVTY